MPSLHGGSLEITNTVPLMFLDISIHSVFSILQRLNIYDTSSSVVLHLIV